MDSDDEDAEASGCRKESIGKSSKTGEHRTSEMHSDVCSGDLGRVVKLQHQQKLSDD